MIKLHLGCGQKYLDGYENIDYPQEKHTVQLKRKVDKEADITKLSYKPRSVGEIRLHHVFEHFDRVTALSLLLKWNDWLEDHGILRIEVPDFTCTAISILSPFSSKKTKRIGLRHIFGSQEASWAVHLHGWSKRELISILKVAGYKVIKIKRNSWKGTYNVEVFACKEREIKKSEYCKIATNYLETFLVDTGGSETQMLKVWVQNFKNITKQYAC